MAVSPELLEILRCPKCRSEVKINEEETKIACQNGECGLVYPVKDGIPVMIIEEAEEAKSGS